MPEVYILLVGAAVAAPLLLFAVLVLNAVERHLELTAREGRLRRSGHRSPPARTPALVLVPGASRPPFAGPGPTAA